MLHHFFPISLSLAAFDANTGKDVTLYVVTLSSADNLFSTFNVIETDPKFFLKRMMSDASSPPVLKSFIKFEQFDKVLMFEEQEFVF